VTPTARTARSAQRVDPSLGERIRELRTAQRLSQAQLAGDDFSDGYISLVETGRTRVSLKAAEILAVRLGVTAADLLRTASTATSSNSQLLLARAQGSLAADRPSDALAHLDALPRSIRDANPEALRLRGRVLIALGRARDALAVLDAAARAYRSRGDEEGRLRATFDLARAHAGLGADAEALGLAAQSEHALAERRIVDRTFELQVTEFIGALAVNMGDFVGADARTERARAIAEDIGDARTVASLYENLSVTRERQDDHEGALLYARKALAIYERLEDQRSVGSSWNTIGWIYVQRKQFARAREALDRADEIAARITDARLHGYVLQTRAELELARGNADDAVRLADESIATTIASERCKALSQLVRARALARTRASHAVVAAAFDRATGALRPLGPRQVARAYQERFAAMLERGRHKDAAESARRAFELLAGRSA